MLQYLIDKAFADVKESRDCPARVLISRNPPKIKYVRILRFFRYH